LCLNGTIFAKQMTNKKLSVVNLQLAFDAIESEKYLGYSICQACCL